MRWIDDVVNPFVSGRKRTRPRVQRGRRRAACLERLEPRYALAAVAPSNFPIQLAQSGTELTITYSQPDPVTGFVQTANQNVVIDIDEFFAGIGAPTQRVNVYASTNPAANFGALVSINKTFLGITAIHVTVPNYDDPGVNNNTLTIKGINGPTDRIIVSGSGRTAAGRWSDEAAPQLQTVFDIAGIDDLTVTAGGVINVSGAFTNDTGDASIHAIGEIIERQSDQTTATIIVGETTPVEGSLPHARLVSNYIEIIGAEIDIYSDIEATGHVILRQPATSPQTARANLILPYDITVTDPDGVLELHSTRNIVQLQSSTLIAHKAVAISNIGDINLVDVSGSVGPWLIDLGSVNNDFDTISLGMVSNAIDTPSQDQSVDARGRIGVRDIDDLTVADFGILATTGIVTIRSVGALTVDAAVQACGLTLQSDTSVASTPRAIIAVNSPTPDTGSSEPVVYTDLGVTIDTSTASGNTASGDVTLDGRIVMDLNNVREDDGVTNKTGYGGLTIHAAGVTTLNSQVLTLGDIRVFSKLGITVAGQLQAGGTFVSKNGTKTELVASDLSLTTATGGITVTAPTANLPLPTTLSATNLLAIDAGGDISIAGSLFAGTIYGNTAKLPEDNATLPSITIRTAADVDMAQTAVLKTSAYGTNYNASPNPQIGLITISDANSVTSAATIQADGGLIFSTRGDITLSGPAIARERISLRTQTGNIDVQGALRSTGAAYTVNANATPPFVVPESWTPDVVLDAPNGAIATSDTGSLTAGRLVLGSVTSYGTVRLNAQQDIMIGADIATPGSFTATSKLGTFDLSALLQTRNPDATSTFVPQITVTAANGIIESDPDLSRIVTPVLELLNTGASGGASDIDLRAKNNQIGKLSARNLAVGGGIYVAGTDLAGTGPLVVDDLTAQRSDSAPSTVSLSSTRGISQTGAIVANNLVVSNTSSAAIVLGNANNNVDNFAASNPIGAISYNDADGFETGVNRAKIDVEVRGDAVTLSSSAAYSTIRVVSGVQYRTLSIGAGNATGASVGTVEFVPTSKSDNPALAGKVPAFGGTLRDMIRYINDNSAVYVANQTTRSQPMALVFDEDGYAVDTITVSAALPTINRAVTFDGGRLEDTVLNPVAPGVPQTRLNITQGATAVPYGLSFAPAIAAVPGKSPAYPGSAGSSIQHVAMYGFTKGSALVLGSGNNTVTDFYAGLRADGTVDASTANSVGLEVTGITASGNRIGSTIVDAASVNRFGGNTSAGILIRNGASGTRVFGSVIGDDTGVTPALANGDGIRISAATGNQIGTPDAVQPDQTDSVSNVIAGNKGSGVAIVNSTAGSLAAGNVVRNNRIAGNRVGVAITGSRFAVLGGADGESGNTIVSQAADGVTIANSLDVQVLGNRIGITPATDLDPEALDGNKGNGVSVTGTSQRVQVASGNRISANAQNGVSIGTGVTAVTVTGNTIGGLLDDGVTAAGNGVDGVAISAAVGNTVGAGNMITKNGRHGVSVVDARATTLATGNRVAGSMIAENAVHGVYVSGGSASTVGGTAAGDANVIQANGQSGIYVDRSARAGAATGYAIQGNFVGTNVNRDIDSSLGNLGGGIVVNDATGVRIESNVVMNNQRASDPSSANDPNDGITLRGGSGNVVGGLTAALANRVTNNQRDGIRVVGPSAARSATGHWITGNTIADNGDGSGNGVTVTGQFARSITVGQAVTTAGVRGLGNVIQRNTDYGVAVTGGAQQVAIQGNSIADNGLGGIYIAPGSNESTAAPGITLTSATLRQPAGSQLQIFLQGSMTRAVKGQQYTVDIYANAAPFGVGFPPATTARVQAQRFLGRITVTATADGTIVWNANNPLKISARVAPGEYITATVTALRVQPGSTSNLSNQSNGVLVRR